MARKTTQKDEKKTQKKTTEKKVSKKNSGTKTSNQKDTSKNSENKGFSSLKPLEKAEQSSKEKKVVGIDISAIENMKFDNSLQKTTENTLENTKKAIEQKAKSGEEKIVDIAKKADEKISQTTKTISNTGEKVLDNASQVLAGTTQSAGKVVEAVGTQVASGGENLKNLAGAIEQGKGKDFVKQGLEKTKKGLFGFFGGAVEKAKQGLGAIKKTIDDGSEKLAGKKETKSESKVDESGVSNNEKPADEEKK